MIVEKYKKLENQNKNKQEGEITKREPIKISSLPPFLIALTEMKVFKSKLLPKNSPKGKFLIRKEEEEDKR